MNLTVSTLRRLLALALVGALAATAVALLTGGGATSAADPEPVAPGANQNPWAPLQSPAELEHTFEVNFALLRSPGGDEIPATAPLDAPGLQVEESRKLTPPPARALARAATSGDVEPEQPDASVFLVPKDDGSQCLIAYLADIDQVSGNCGYPAEAAEGRFVITQSRDGVEAGIFGLMPDGIDSVTIDLADGTSAEVPVVDNAYLAQFDRPTAGVRWIDGDGIEQYQRIGSGG